MMEIRAFLIALLVAGLAFGAMFNFMGSVASTNNGTFPSSFMNSTSSSLSQLNQTMLINIHQSVNSTDTNLATPTTSLGLVGDFMVFGGAIISVFNDLVGIPQAVSNLFIMYSGVPILGLVVIAVGSVVLAIVLVEIFMEILSYIGKYRT